MTTALKPYPLWVRLPYALFVAMLVPVYWRDYGPSNVLWFSDIALFALLIALWTGNRLVYSMMAVTILPPLAYLGLYMLLLPLAVILPMHLLMRRLFRA